MKHPAIIGVTGGIGSGKSTVCALFAQKGYAVYEADTRAKAVMHTDPELRAGLLTHFGPEALLPDGSLNRAHIGQQAFGDPQKLAALNALVHPAVKRDFAAWIQTLVDQGYAKPFVLREAAILYESGSWQDCHRVVCVYAPKSVRLARAMARDTAPEAAILSRMDKQWADRDKLIRADHWIINDGSHPQGPQVDALERRLVEELNQL
jgi:dephospho-CoA kinase